MQPEINVRQNHCRLSDAVQDFFNPFPVSRTVTFVPKENTAMKFLMNFQKNARSVIDALAGLQA